LIVERKFIEFFDELAHDDFGKCHESSLWVWGHGEVVLEQASTLSGADPGAKVEGVAVVEGGGCFDDD
jgi:hypothetical protein